MVNRPSSITIRTVNGRFHGIESFMELKHILNRIKRELFVYLHCILYYILLLFPSIKRKRIYKKFYNNIFFFKDNNIISACNIVYVFALSF